MPLKQVQIDIFHINCPGNPKLWAIAHETAQKRKNDGVLVIPLKHLVSVMGLENHPGNPKQWAIAQKMAINAKTVSFWSCLSNMY
jgi:hypothetical protein